MGKVGHMTWIWHESQPHRICHRAWTDPRYSNRHLLFMDKKRPGQNKIFTITHLSINLHAGYTWSILINSVWNEFHIYFFLVCKILIVSFTWTRVCVTWSRFRILTWAAACRYGMYWSGLWAVPTRRATGAPFPNTITTGAWMIHVNEIHTCRFKTD